MQEYGKRNASLIAGLEARGARVLSLQVYQWDLPVDLGPLQENIRRLGRKAKPMWSCSLPLSKFNMSCRSPINSTSRTALRAGMRKAVVASVGPTTSEMLRQCDLPVDLEPSHPKLGHLVVEVARQAHELLARKQIIQQTSSTSRSRRRSMRPPPGTTARS